jgi:hypothetical protein
MVTGIASKNVIKFNVVDFIVGLGLEALENNFVFLIADLQLHVVEDGAEAGVRDEAALALVLVLEEGLDQEALVADEPAETLEASIQNLLLILGKHILRVKDRWSLKIDGLLQGVFLEVLKCEDRFDCLIEINVVYLVRIVRYWVGLLKQFIFFVSQVDLLCKEDSSELLRGNGTLSKRVVVLEELTQADAVLLNLSLKLEEKLVKG